MMVRNSLRSLLYSVALIVMPQLLVSCYKQQAAFFSEPHAYGHNYNFVVKTDSMSLFDSPDTLIDSTVVYKGDQLVVAEIKTVPSDSIDSVWVKLARDQMSQGWQRECVLLSNVAPDDPISQFIDMFSDNHLLLFLALVVIVTATYGLLKLYRRDAYLVHFHDIGSMLPTLLTMLVATSATVYATIQNFAPGSWQHFYFHPTLNPFALTPVLGVFVVLVWSLIIVGIAVVEDVVRRLPLGSALLYLLGLSAICAVDYVVFSVFSLYYVGYVLLVLYWWFAVYRLRLFLHRYVCGKCGAGLNNLGKCPFCGAINE